MRRIVTLTAAALLFLPALADAQTIQTARNYQGQDGQTKEAIGTFCVPDTAGNGCSAGGGGGTVTATRSTAAGTSDTQAVPVQGVTGGVPQNVTSPAGALALDATTSTMSGKLPSSLGPKTATASLSTAPATDGIWPTVQQTSAAAATGVSPVASAAASGGVIVKASAGNLYGLNVASGATAGVVQVINATAIPADGAVAPLKCYYLAASSSLDLNLRAAPVYFSTGVVVVFSTGASCFTKAASATAFISGDAR